MRKLIYLKKGFTLAEVLITLGIIGIVAAMTIPTVLQNAQNQQTISLLKKAYSSISQAYNLSVQDNGTPDTWALGGSNGDSGGSMEILNKLSPYLKITKNCGNGTGCFPNVVYKVLYGPDWSNPDTDTRFAKIQLTDGELIAFFSYGNCNNVYGTSQALQNACGTFSIDVNNFKGPNQWGIDWFGFYITRFGLLPIGTQQDTAYPFDTRCKDKTTMAGDGCTAWVIYNENMDYLKCSNLSWSGPTKCP